MWQRKQSIFLFLAALLCFSTWLFPIASFERADGVHKLMTTGLIDAEGLKDINSALVLPFSIMHTVLGAGLLLCIVLYKNRKRQMRVVRGTYLLILPVIAFQYITLNSASAYLAEDGALSTRFELSFFIPVVVLVLAFLAERSIKADEALVRSADRLR